MRVKAKTDKLHFGILVCMVLFAFSSCSMIGMNNLPKGELMETVSSPNGQYEINSYLVSGNATVDFSVRCEVVEVSTMKKRNVFWEYRCEKANVEWIDDVTVKNNGKRLNILTDSYDWRNNS